ncbi:hypothetical protein [Bifidobacterium simiarum]|uniref:hypothetical protein n=1 Tax=Bifidobacterium simiarum TaxID=2045441 RepID=UPI001BDD8BCC|nr:hypothetical protein [Bifidobacterium simiarum]MBT1166242.1 hypothetical protein [Bifidobacterium simiarum]
MEKLHQFVKDHVVGCFIAFLAGILVIGIIGYNVGTAGNSSPSKGSGSGSAPFLTSEAKLTKCTDTGNTEAKLNDSEAKMGNEPPLTVKVSLDRYDKDLQRIYLKVDITNDGDKAVRLGELLPSIKTNGENTGGYVTDDTKDAAELSEDDRGTKMIDAHKTVTYYHIVEGADFASYNDRTGKYDFTDQQLVFYATSDKTKDKYGLANVTGNAICTVVKTPDSLKKDVEVNGVVVGKNFEHVKFNSVKSTSDGWTINVSCENKTGKTIAACDDLYTDESTTSGNSYTSNGVDQYGWSDSQEQVADGKTGTMTAHYDEQTAEVRFFSYYLGDEKDNSYPGIDQYFTLAP